MTDQYTTGSLDQAILAADEILADPDRYPRRLDLAAAVTTAVVPHILGQIEEALVAGRVELAGARAANAHVRDEIRTISEQARAQTRRLARAFEEIDPDAVATQILAEYEAAGHRPDGRDRAFARLTVRRTITALSSAISLSLSFDDTAIEQL